MRKGKLYVAGASLAVLGAANLAAEVFYGRRGAYPKLYDFTERPLDPELETVVVAHGMGGSGKAGDVLLRPLMEHGLGIIKGGVNLVSWDLWGHGETAKETKLTGRITIEDAAVNHLERLDALGIKKCHGLAVSLGAGIQLVAAMLDPDRFESLTVFEPVISGEFGEWWQPPGYKYVCYPLYRGFRRTPFVGNALRELSIEGIRNVIDAVGSVAEDEVTRCEPDDVSAMTAILEGRSSDHIRLLASPEGYAMRDTALTYESADQMAPGEIARRNTYIRKFNLHHLDSSSELEWIRAIMDFDIQDALHNFPGVPLFGMYGELTSSHNQKIVQMSIPCMKDILGPGRMRLHRMEGVAHHGPSRHVTEFVAEHLRFVKECSDQGQ